MMGPGQKFLTQVRSIFCGSGRVSHLWFGFEFGKFPLKTSNFSIFFPSGQKESRRVGKSERHIRPFFNISFPLVKLFGPVLESSITVIMLH